MTHKYDLGDIFIRRHVNQTYHVMIMDFMAGKSIPTYLVLILESGQYDKYPEGYFQVFEKVA